MQEYGIRREIYADGPGFMECSYPLLQKAFHGCLMKIGGMGMAQVYKKGFNAEMVWGDLENCCRSEAVCGECKHGACVVGYAKKCVDDYLEEPKKVVPDGTENVPIMDYKTFDEVELEIAIAHILKECKDCKGDHVDDCIINVIRNCYEVALFGEMQPFEGSTFQYLVRLESEFPDKVAQIASAYRG